jgi:hypothetical protein
MAGKIQNEDIKSSAELASAGATDASLPNDDKIYVTANSLNKTLKDAITDGDIGGGSGGGKNYFSFNQFRGNTTDGFNAYADAAGALPVDGTGGSPSGSLSLIVSPSPLSGDNSLILDKVGSTNLQGQGKSIDFALDVSDRGKVLAFTMNYAVSTDYADDDQIIYFYDVTNSQLLEPVPFKIKKHTLTSDRFFCEVQVPYNCSTIRLIFHTASTSTQNYLMKIDDLCFGPQAKLYGSVATDWVSYTPTGNWTTNTFYSGKWRRVGDSMEIQARVGLSGGGPNAAVFSVNLPSGYSIDTSKLSSTTNDIQAFGSAMTSDFGTGYHVGTVVFATATSVHVIGETASVWTQAVPQTWASADDSTLIFKVPIVGWSSSQLLSSDAITRQISTIMAMNSSQTGIAINGSSAKININYAPIDSHGSFNSGLTRYEAKFSGMYSINARAALQGANIIAGSEYRLFLTKNGSEIARGQSYVGVSGIASNLILVTSLYLNVGDYLELYIFGTGNNSVSTLTIYGDGADAYYTSMSVKLDLGPSQIAASEKIKARYIATAGQSIPNASSTIVDFNQKVYDTHGSVTTGGSWKFTAQRYGFLTINSMVTFAAGTFTTTGDCYIELFKNGSSSTVIDFHRTEAGGAFNQPVLQGLCEIEMNAGDYVDVRVYQNESSARSLAASGAFVKIELTLE